MDKVEEITQKILEKFERHGVKVNKSEIKKRVDLLLNEFKVPEGEIIRTITNYLIREHGLPREILFERESPLVKIAEITKPGVWVSVKAKVAQLWDTSSPNVSQVGLIGDETGMIKFVIWAKSGKEEVEEGKSYLFKNVVTDSFQGRMQINVNRFSSIVELEEDIPLPPREVSIVGALVSIQQGSGLIQRCGVCGRAMIKESCPEHGKVESYDDLRIKGVLDDGESVYEIILNEENVKSLTGIGLEEAKKIAQEKLDRGAVLSELKSRLLGRYFKVTGTKGGRYILVKEVDFYKPELKEFKLLGEAI